jgi:hypothetical protein
MKTKGEPAQLALGGQLDKSAASQSVHSYSTPILVGRQIVGRVRGNVFSKRLRSSRHLLRLPRAWALDARSLRDAETAGAKFVEIQDRDTGQTYSASTARIRERGFTVDRGHGRQIALLLEEWAVAATDRPLAHQLALAVGTPS